MANPDAVGQTTQDSFSNFRLGVVRGTSLNTSGNGAVTNIVIPLLNGGLTNAGAVLGSGGVIVRRVTIQNPNGSVASANISVSSTNNGANLVAANTVISSVSAVGTFQDITPSPAVFVSGNTTSCLYVNVNTVSGNANTVDIVVWGDVVNF
jgi:hypothetical protein